ncbi:MAG: LacI family transcriptional regulator [Calditrichaeota bacterium]|nr:LacI family transcriptional regulator [Calditrichota bacterium]
MPRATIKDIARILGISPSTVSRALNNHPAISGRTKHLVGKVARELNYYPNSIAQNLKQKRSYTIGVIVPEIRHEFFSSAISGIEDVAYREGYTIIVSQSDEDVEREKINTRSMITNRVDGLIVSKSQTTVDGSHFKKAIDLGIPVVFFNRICADVPANRVIADDFNGAYNAVGYLIGKGYRKIAHFAGPRHLPVCEERYRGYEAAIKDAGIPLKGEWICWGGMHEKDGVRSMKKILKLKEKPEAIFAVNDPVAIGAFMVIKQNGFRIPGDFALIGFSNNPVVSIIDPPMTTVDEKPYDLGKSAMELMLDQLRNDTANTVRTVKLETELIIRQST